MYWENPHSNFFFVIYNHIFFNEFEIRLFFFQEKKNITLKFNGCSLSELK